MSTMRAAVFETKGRISIREVPRPGLGEIEEAYELFSQQRDGVLKVAIRP